DPSDQKPSDLTIQYLPKLLRPLRELQTHAAQSIIDYIEKDLTTGLETLVELRSLETGHAIDSLCKLIGFTGPSSDFLEAATELFHEIDPSVPKIYRVSIAPLFHELSSLVVQDDASPGELF